MIAEINNTILTFFFSSKFSMIKINQYSLKYDLSHVIIKTNQSVVYSPGDS